MWVGHTGGDRGTEERGGAMGNALCCILPLNGDRKLLCKKYANKFCNTLWSVIVMTNLFVLWSVIMLTYLFVGSKVSSYIQGTQTAPVHPALLKSVIQGTRVGLRIQLP